MALLSRIQTVIIHHHCHGTVHSVYRTRQMDLNPSKFAAWRAPLHCAVRVFTFREAVSISPRKIWRRRWQSIKRSVKSLLSAKDLSGPIQYLHFGIGQDWHVFMCPPSVSHTSIWTICQMWAWEAVRKYLNFQFLRLGWDFRCLIFWLEKHVALSPSLKVFGVGSLQFLHVSKFCQVQILHTTQALPRRWFLTSRSLYVP